MYNITKHAAQRYAERIMEKDEKCDVAVFVAQHQEKINEDINKMIEYGDEIYDSLFIKDTWIIHVDKAKNNVITLYKVDFGVGEDFNKEYVLKIRQKLDEAVKRVEDEKNAVDSKIKEHQEIIENNKKTIAEYAKISKSLNEQNEMYKSIINSMRVNIEVAEQEVKDIISKLTERK